LALLLVALAAGGFERLAFGASLVRVAARGGADLRDESLLLLLRAMSTSPSPELRGHHAAAPAAK
jgi:hypothetical protein